MKYLFLGMMVLCGVTSLYVAYLLVINITIGHWGMAALNIGSGVALIYWAFSNWRFYKGWRQWDV